MNRLEENVVWTETRFCKTDNGGCLEIKASQIEGDGFTARINVPLTEEGIDLAISWGASMGELLARVFTEALGGPS